LLILLRMNGRMSDIQLREYQQDILEFAKTRNTICVLPTGMGKTLIAFELATYIKNCARENDEAPLVTFFLSPTCNLTVQQSGALRSRYPDLNVVECSGSQMTYYYDDWRRRFALSGSIVFMTPQVFLDSLRHAFLTLEEVDLLVFDECHNTRSNSPYNMIMHEFYFRGKMDGLRLPRILGLTASPSTQLSSFEQQLDQLESDLDSVVFTSSRGLGKYFREAKEEVLRYEAPPWTLALPAEVMRIVEGSMNSDGGSSINPESVLHCYAELGAWGMYEVIKPILGYSKPDEPKPFAQWKKEKVFSDKVEKLVQFLIDYPEEKRNSFHGILFCERIKVCTLMVKLLQVISDLSWIRCTCITGHGVKGNKGMSSSVQMATMTQFRSHEFNLAVATSVVEEGLDVGTCNVVIRFFEPPTLQAHVQSKGRGRAEGARYILMSSFRYSTGSDTAQYNDKLKQLETRKRCFQIPLDHMQPLEFYESPVTGAIATLQSSIALVHRWCASMHGEPEWVGPNVKTSPSGVKTTLGCSLCSPVQECITKTYDGMPNDTMKKRLALEVVKYLHQRGFLDDFLLPAGQNVDHSLFSGRYHPVIWRAKNGNSGGSHKGEMVSIPWVKPPEVMSEPLIAGTNVHIMCVTVTTLCENADGKFDYIHRSFALVSRKALLTERVEIHPAGKKVSSDHLSFVPLEKMDLEMDEESLKIAQKCTEILFSCVLRTKTKKDLCFDWTKTERHVLVLPLKSFCEGRDPEIDWDQCDEIVARESRNIFNEPKKEDMVLFCDRLYHSLSLRPGVTVNSIVPGTTKSIIEYVAESGIILMDLNQPIYSSRVYNSKPRVHVDAKEKKTFDLPSEGLHFWPLRLGTHVTMRVLAENIWHLEHDILVREFASRQDFSALHPMFRGDFDSKLLHRLLVQALTAPCVNKPRFGDYDKLEFLGDAILKYACVVTLIPTNVAAKVNSLSAKKNEIVSNNNLFNMSQASSIPSFLQTEASPWLKGVVPGTFAIKQRDVPSKVIADSVESLTGAVFMSHVPGCTCGPSATRPSDQDLKFAWIDAQRFLIECGLPLMDASELCIWDWDSLGQGEKIPTSREVREIQAHLGVSFTKLRLLEAALTQEVLSSVNNYERLEFLGDAILDGIVTQELFLRYGNDPQISVGQLNNARSHVVQNDTFAYLALRLGLNRYIRCSAEASEILSQYEDTVALAQSVMEDDFSMVQPPRKLFGSGPKFLADVFEACAGLVYIQFNCDIVRTSHVVLPWIRCVLDHAIEYGEMSSVRVRRFIQEHPSLQIIMNPLQYPNLTQATGKHVINARLDLVDDSGHHKLLKSFTAEGWDRTSSEENVCDLVWSYLEDEYSAH